MASHNYRLPGWYFITIITFCKQPLFGHIHNAKVIHNQLGEEVDRCIQTIPHHHSNGVIDKYVVMPNHVHFLLYLKKDLPRKEFDELRSSGNRPSTMLAGSVSSIVNHFKGAVTRYSRKEGIVNRVWPKGYHDRILFNEKELNTRRRYIEKNPRVWWEKYGKK